MNPEHDNSAPNPAENNARDFPILLTQDSRLLEAILNDSYVRFIVAILSGASLRVIDDDGNTPLHIAAARYNLRILWFIVSEEIIPIDTRNEARETPLFRLINMKRYNTVKFAKCLIKAGTDVNIPNNTGVTPLHSATGNPKLAKLLILNGADIDAGDQNEMTPLHYAVNKGCLETTCMLLYYNVDANILDVFDETPFMRAIILNQRVIEIILFDYVVDFNIYNIQQLSMLELSLMYNSPCLFRILDKDTTLKISITALNRCNAFPHPRILQRIRNRLEHGYRDIELQKLIDPGCMSVERIERYINVIYGSPNIMSSISIPSYFLTRFLYVHCSSASNLELVTKLVCLLLENSYVMKTSEINLIFRHYGYCDLIRILMHMEYKHNWSNYYLTAKLVFDVFNNGLAIPPHIIMSNSPIDLISRKFKNDVLNYLRYCCNTELMERFKRIFPNEAVNENYPRVPSLIQLARDKFREHLVNQLQITSTCQYYTIINDLNISREYKKILTFERTLYNVLPSK